MSYLRQTDWNDVGRPADRPIQLEDGDVVVEADARELGMCVYLLHGVGFGARGLVISLQVNVSQSHRELPREKTTSGVIKQIL